MMLFIKEGIKKDDLKSGDTVYYTLTEDNNIPQNFKPGDKISGKVIKIDVRKGVADIKWEDGQTDKDFSINGLTLNKD